MNQQLISYSSCSTPDSSKKSDFSPLPIKQQIYYQGFDSEERTQRKQSNAKEQRFQPADKSPSYHDSFEESLEYYKQRCIDLEEHIKYQNDKISDLLEYQQSILEKLEDTNQQIHEIYDENLQLQSEMKQMSLVMHQMEESLKVQNMQYQHTGISQNEEKFLNCILNMVTVCHPPQPKPISLKQAWRWLKQILVEYMDIRKRIDRQNRSGMTESQSNNILVGALLRKNQMKITESQYVRNQ